MSWLLWLMLLGLLAWFMVWSLRIPPPLMGVYSRPSKWYWVKVAVFYALVKLRRWQGGRGEASEKGNVGYGRKSRPSIESMECVQPLTTHPKAIDAVYFNGANANGQYIVAATARRPHGVVNGILYIRLPGVGMLQLPRMPDTLLFGDGEGFGAEGLKINPVKPMAHWKIQYKGAMKIWGDVLSSKEVEMNLEFKSDLPYFDFDTDMDTVAMARSMSREPWSKEYFENLKNAHQTHYEQMGRIEGTVIVDGHPHVLRLDHGMRDHSYGHKREWKLLHRYGLHMFTTEDGDQVNVGIVSQPVTCSQLELGYIYENGKLKPVSSVTLPLWQHGENGHPPAEYAFSFIAGGKEYVVEVFVVEAPEFYMGWEWEARLVERFATFKLNGRKGWGVTEWDYRHHGGRPHVYAASDPAWTKDIVKG
ncbi:hypothetical protein SK128_024757 [Halocaridina rubra]|uniref:DUF7064 domain-containing protein n=1 Tax=Halocaridina rubra TaxID=373956 RepID=A0AAN8X4D4_HALRR